MKVMTINSGYDGCNYLRLHLPTVYNGWWTDKPSLSEDKISIKDVREHLQAADVVVFHRAEEQEYHVLAKLLKKDGKKIVMDNDDTFVLDDFHPLAQFTSDGKFQEHLQRRSDNIDEFIKLCDLVTTTTKTLKKEYDKLNDNVVILPNCVDPYDWDEPLRNEGDKVRIGIVGSAAIEYDYHHIKDLIKRLGDREDVELVLFGLGDLSHRKDNPKVTEVFRDEYKFWDSVNMEQFPWVKRDKYNDTLNEARLDIMIIPRRDNYFNRCKSNVKFLEAAMCEIPVIAQSFEDGPYQEISDGINGFLIKDNKEWEDKVNMLIDNKELRRKVGENAYRYAIENYNIEENHLKWDKAYKSLFK